MKKIRNWVIGLVVLGGLLYFGYRVVTRPLPGEAVSQLSRDHVTDIAGVNYNSNPPTSGPHFTIWAKAGVYDRLISDGYLIHSLEHGYVILNYDCSKLAVSRKLYAVSQALAHDELAKESTDSGQPLKHMKIQLQGDMSWFTPENPPEIEIELPDSFQSQSCKDLASKLAEFTKVAERVIVVPRVGMDSPIALTTWGRILKLNSVDTKLITDFIKAFHNRGPEQTDE